MKKLSEMNEEELDAMAKHVVEKQIKPQMLAAELGADIAFVNTNPNAEGYEVECYKCHRKAKLPFKVPEGKGVLCPNCIPRSR